LAGLDRDGRRRAARGPTLTRRYLVSVVGPDRVLFGTDWPHQVHDVVGSLANTAALPPDQRDAIRGSNALRLFGL
jgi:aminocarboxymuconate-semialdehyde decarboxylase